MQLLNDELLKQFREVGSQEEIDDPMILTKFFSPTGTASWFAYEYDEENRLFYCWVSIFRDWNDELGPVSLDELQEYRGKLGLGIERDLFFKPKRLSEVKRELYGDNSSHN